MARRVPTKVAAVVTALLSQAGCRVVDRGVQQSELSLTRVMNQVRATYGLRPLPADARLERAARVHSSKTGWLRLRYPLVVLIVLGFAFGASAAEKFTPAAAATTSAPAGAILYSKHWENGLVESNGWGQQASVNLGTNPINGIVYGTINPDTTTANRGKRSGKFSLPASSYKQGAMMLHNRTVQNGSDEWFAMAFYFPSGWRAALTGPGGARHTLNLGCPNYYSVNSCIVSVSGGPRSLFTLINSGACTKATGCPWYSATPQGGNYSRCRGFKKRGCGPLYIVPPGHLRLNVWHEIVMHVYYTLDRNGLVQFWHRIKGRSSWRKRVSVTGGFPTLQTGTTAFGATVTASNISGWRSTDQFGLYRWVGETDAATVSADDWCRATSFASAVKCFR